jgi:hypothetical protein
MYFASMDHYTWYRTSQFNYYTITHYNISLISQMIPMLNFKSTWVFSCVQNCCDLQTNLSSSNRFLRNMKFYELCDKTGCTYNMSTVYTWEMRGKIEHRRWQLHILQWKSHYKIRKDSTILNSYTILSSYGSKVGIRKWWLSLWSKICWKLVHGSLILNPPQKTKPINESMFC